VSDKRGKLILALLEEARQQGQTAISKTALIKLIYLADYYYCQEKGRTWTGWEWRFVHFGPFAPAAAQMLDDLVLRRHILMEKRQSEDKEFVLYSLPERGQAPSLRDIDVPIGAAINIRADLKR
jgi:hypothetical protein